MTENRIDYTFIILNKHILLGFTGIFAYEWGLQNYALHAWWYAGVWTRERREEAEEDDGKWQRELKREERRLLLGPS